RARRSSSLDQCRVGAGELALGNCGRGRDDELRLRQNQRELRAHESGAIGAVRYLLLDQQNRGDLLIRGCHWFRARLTPCHTTDSIGAWNRFIPRQNSILRRSWKSIASPRTLVRSSTAC